MGAYGKLGVRWAALLGALFGATGCGEDAGHAHITGFLTVPGCITAPAGSENCAGDAGPGAAVCDTFDLGIDFLTLEREGDQVIVRLQHGGEDFANEDGLFLHLADLTLPRGRLGEPIAVGPEEPVRAALALFERCPASPQSFELRGQVTFTEFGVSKGDRVMGNLDELVVRDARTGALLGRLHGDFDFTVRRGPPYRRFSGP